MLNILLIADIVSKIILLVTFARLAMYGQQGIKRSQRFMRCCNTLSGDKIYHTISNLYMNKYKI